MSRRTPSLVDLAGSQRALESRQRAERENLDLQHQAARERSLRALQGSLHKRGKKPQNVLVIGDSHASPGISNARYTWLGRFIADQGPDVVVDIGDWWDLGALSSYDFDKASGEVKRYQQDLDAGLDADDKMQAAMGGHVPIKIRTLGNHEDRISRYVNANPRLVGTVGTFNLESEERGWSEVPFKENVDVGGVLFSHYFSCPEKGVEIKGVAQCRAVSLKLGVSAVFGHTHRFEHFERVDGRGTRICTTNAGCYFEHFHGWEGRSVHSWRRGLLYLRNLQNGSYDVDWWSIERIREAYGR